MPNRQGFATTEGRRTLATLHVDRALRLASVGYDAIAPPGERFSGRSYAAAETTRAQLPPLDEAAA